ncbi:MAG TPA: dioxygenase [Anaerolineae bacterium]|nr:dioxygenase [Anaerolineae bacterium]
MIHQRTARPHVILFFVIACFVAGCASLPQATATPTREPVAPAPADAQAPPASATPTVAVPTPAPAMTPTPTQAQAILPTPACSADTGATPAMTEGPYYTPNAPERTSLLEPGMTGTRIVISGYVLSTDCQPIPGALVDFWQADADGVYDNAGYRLRGRQYTDANGRYTLETVVPGLYPGRTRHIHVKVQAPGGPILTTQLFFPGEAQNDTDTIFDPGLLLSPVQETGNDLTATFDFVVEQN